MTAVVDRFAEALRGRLEDSFQGSFAEGGDLLARARQAQVPESTVTSATAEALDKPYAESLSGMAISHEFVSVVPIAYARKHGLIGLAGDSEVMSVAIADLSAWGGMQILTKILKKDIRPLFAPRDEILRTINAAYQQQSSRAQQVIEQLDADNIMAQLDQVGANEDLLDVATRAPVIKLVNLMLFEAVKRRASDVHVQPYEDKLIVRFRVDGVLHDVFEPPRALQAEIISRIKVMGQMNIAERRLAQDGRATVEVGDRIVDLRIATLPTCFGERAVIRLLDKSIRLYNLGELGMPESISDAFGNLIRTDHGIVLVTGPTGSGKSTTLYAALQEIDSDEMNVLTLEDPIEYRLEGISQTQISDKKGMTFAGGLRHVLRQDPDIIMVGEIRDGETAQMAIQSALTGHLVFSTLHTNDAAGAVARMLDLGVEPYLLASSLLGVLAQRLVRRICPKCKELYRPTDGDLRVWGVSPGQARTAQYFKGRGCGECLQTGYRRRVGIFELLLVNETARELILQRAKASSLKFAAAEAGMTTLRAAGLAKAAAGITTMDEVARVTGRDET